MLYYEIQDRLEQLCNGASWSFASGLGRLQRVPETFRQVASYGTPRHEELLERTALLCGAHAELHEPLDWNVFQWQSGRHRAVVVVPCSSFEALVVGILLRGSLQKGDYELEEIPSSQLYIMFELVVAPDGDFFPMVGVMPNFDAARPGTKYLGKIQRVRLVDISNKAKAVVSKYAKYGLIGCNCQHFVEELSASLGVNAIVPEDESAFINAAGVAGAAMVGWGCGVTVAGMTVVGTAGMVAGAVALPVVGAAAGVQAEGGGRRFFERIEQAHRRSGDEEPRAHTPTEGVEQPCDEAPSEGSDSNSE